MISIRKGVFETNSSSTHALTILPEDKIDKEYFNLDYEIRDGYLMVRLNGTDGFSEYGDFESFTSKLGYLTSLRIAAEFGRWDCEKIRPGEVEENDVIKSWFSDVVSRLLMNGVYVKGIDLGLNYAPDSEEDEDYDDYEVSPVMANGKIDEDFKNSHYLKFSIDHQVVESFIDCAKWGTVFVRKPYKSYDGKEEVCNVICMAGGEYDDLDVLFSPKVGIRYTWDVDPVETETVVEVKI